MTFVTQLLGLEKPLLADKPVIAGFQGSGPVVVIVLGKQLAELPGLIGAADFLGREPGDIPIQPRLELVEANSLLEEWNVDYIWLGPREKLLGTWRPSIGPGLEMVLESGEYVLYRVLPEAILP